MPANETCPNQANISGRLVCNIQSQCCSTVCLNTLISRQTNIETMTTLQYSTWWALKLILSAQTGCAGVCFLCSSACRKWSTPTQWSLWLSTHLKACTRLRSANSWSSTNAWRTLMLKSSLEERRDTWHTFSYPHYFQTETCCREQWLIVTSTDCHLCFDQ